jgi:hypothetical protein
MANLEAPRRSKEKTRDNKKKMDLIFIEAEASAKFTRRARFD